MKILVLGSDGYIGKPLSIFLEESGHEIFRLDNLSRRVRAPFSLTDIGPLPFGTNCIDLSETDLSQFPIMDTIIHLAEQPSAPWSMKNYGHAKLTQIENIAGTLSLLWAMKERMPDAHLIKLGSMGEYGTPNTTIPEGMIPNNCLTDEYYQCPLGGMMFPRQPGSFYHLSKVFDTMNIEFACKIWGLRSTDIMQGVVFGINHWDKDSDVTRFDYDEHFGTVINRFCVQAIAGYPLTVYGAGGQTRGYLPLSDSIECLFRAVLNPPKSGEYRVFNQYAKIYSVMDLAKIVQSVGNELGLNVQIEHIKNPRIEQEQHIYNTTNEGLKNIGYNPQWELSDEIKKLLKYIIKFKDRVNTEIIAPNTNWV